MALKTSPEGKVMCGFCGTTLLIKTYNCPFRYCEQIAMCPSCSKERRYLRIKAGHRYLGCEENSIKVKAQTRGRQEIIISGQFLLASTRHVEGELVHAIFRSETARVGRYLPESVLVRAEQMPNPTIADFENLSGLSLPEAPSEFDSPNATAMLSAATLFFSTKQPQAKPSTGSMMPDQASLF